ncbi:hypothetical protein CTAM01_07062 [Colletotrichum tamarilloi]|uniref:Uncharacterized protein n=1 Tax=Colletotrichum tamarilloi TaxID=1209934 RepID=A0ABQ9R9U2_9PEZI|nr:uncharacterized protein CTAM01_07062 [Colletotrichum tamarilloi]KAK1499141.1 hypothetical protein CTAM01_07062 [Colletotrichum tamarilloi]
MLSMASSWRIRAQPFDHFLNNDSVVSVPSQAGSLTGIILHLGDSLPAGHLGSRAASGSIHSALWVRPCCKVKLLRGCRFRPQTPCYTPRPRGISFCLQPGLNTKDFVDYWHQLVAMRCTEHI